MSFGQDDDQRIDHDWLDVECRVDIPRWIHDANVQPSCP